MFTGIVEKIGTVVGVEPRAEGCRIRVEAGFDDLVVGESIAISGCCLTVVEADGDVFAADVVPETLGRTNLSALAPGDQVNLERSMPADGRFGGHIVQGHVDGPALLAERRESASGVVFRFEISRDHARYVVEKGSVAIDGVSLTVAAAGADWFEVALIPHTLQATTLGTSHAGWVSNLELDIVAKYVERLVESTQARSDG